MSRPRRSALARRQRLKDSALALAFLGPSLVVFVMFAFYPFIRTIENGLRRPNYLGTSYKYVGVQQYVDVLTGSDFRNGLVHTLIYVVCSVPAGLILGTLLAVAADRKIRGIRFFQTIFSSTIATSVAVSSLIFFFLINKQIGVFQVDWLSNPHTVLPAISLTSIWQNLGLSFVIVLAGLQAVPTEVLEAATLDGYGPIRRFFKVTLPLLSPVLLFLVVVLVIYAFQVYAQIEFLSNGGPAGASETLLFKIFKYRDSDPGVASVMAVGLFAVTFVVTMIQFSLLNRRVHYAS